MVGCRRRHLVERYYPSGSWETQLDRIETVVAAAGRPFFFMEAGCPSRAGSAAAPNDWSLPGAVSEEEQRVYYAEMLEATSRRDWVRGLMLWDWPASLYPEHEARPTTTYCPFGKSAGRLLRDSYAARTVRSESRMTGSLLAIDAGQSAIKVRISGDHSAQDLVFPASRRTSCSLPNSRPSSGMPLRRHRPRSPG